MISFLWKMILVAAFMWMWLGHGGAWAGVRTGVFAEVPTAADPVGGFVHWAAFVQNSAILAARSVQRSQGLEFVADSDGALFTRIGEHTDVQTILQAMDARGIDQVINVSVDEEARSDNQGINSLIALRRVHRRGINELLGFVVPPVNGSVTELHRVVGEIEVGVARALDQSAHLEVVVVSSQTREILDASVEEPGRQSAKREGNRWTLDILPGTHAIRAEIGGYVARTISVTLREGEARRVHLPLDPMAEITVHVRPRTAVTVGSEDAVGTHTFTVAPGKVMILARKGRRTYLKDVRVAPGEHQDIHPKLNLRV